MSLQTKTDKLLTDHAVNVNKYAYSQRKSILAQLSYILKEIRKELLVGEMEVSTAESKAIVNDAVKLFKEKFKAIRQNIDDELVEFINTDASGQVELMEDLISTYNDTYKYTVPSDSVLKKQLDIYPIQGVLMTDWLDKFEETVATRMRGAIYQATNGEINADGDIEEATRVSVVNNVFGVGGSSNILVQPIFARPAIDLNAQLLSFTVAASAIVSNALVQHNTGVIVGRMWNSCLCSTTCPTCSSLHGAIVYTDGKDETGGMSIPVHMNCACYWTYVYKEARLMNARIPKESQDKINSSEKPKTFIEYFAGLSDTKKKQLFGTKRLALLESGAIKVTKLLDLENGRRMFTLKELREQGYELPLS